MKRERNGNKKTERAVGLEKMLAFTILNQTLQLSDGLVTLRNEGYKFGQVSKIKSVVFRAPACPGN